MCVPRLSCSHSASAQLHRCNLGVDQAVTISYLDVYEGHCQHESYTSYRNDFDRCEKMRSAPSAA